MLKLVKKYGLSHVCALEQFKNIGTTSLNVKLPYNFPNLDIHLSGAIGLLTFAIERNVSAIKFYYRGANDRKLEFQNLFEYLLWAASNG